MSASINPVAITWSGASQNRRILAVYAEKGGVGKTTTSSALAFQYASMGHRVVIYDCDPQRSLSAWLLQSKLDLSNDRPYDSYVNDSTENKVGNATNPKTLLDQIAPVVQQGINTEPLPARVIHLAGKGPDRGVSPVHDVGDNWDAQKLKKSAMSVITEEDLEPWNEAGRVFLVPGHRRINIYDADFATANALLDMMPNLVINPAIPYHCILRTANEYDADIVILDLNPSGGWLNVALLMSSHYIVVPAIADFYSDEMARNLAQAMVEMREKCQRFVRRYDELYPPPLYFAGTMRYRFPSHRVKILGHVLTRFSLAVGQRALEVQADGLIGDQLLATERRWFESLGVRFDELHATLLPHGMVIDGDIYRQLNRNLCVGKVRDYFALGDRSHDLALPVIALSLSSTFRQTTTFDQRDRLVLFQRILRTTVRTLESLMAADRLRDVGNVSFPALP